MASNDDKNHVSESVAQQTSKSAVSRVSKPAGGDAGEPTWKSAIWQVWKSARHGQVRAKWTPGGADGQRTGGNKRERQMPQHPIPAVCQKYRALPSITEQYRVKKQNISEKSPTWAVFAGL
jgi:hypothetical protein